MAIYKIFPFKDSTLYSSQPNSNFGLDAISEVKNTIGIDGNPDVTRFLTQFDSTEISNIINNKISGSNWDVNFRSFIAEAYGINTEHTLELFPIAQEWNSGTGEFGDSPSTTNGVTWVDSLSLGLSPWNSSGSVGTELYTSSFNPLYSTQGGGNWFYSGSNIPTYKVTQSFDLRSYKDIDLNVKTIVSSWYSGSIPNNGLIIKLDSNSEFGTLTDIDSLYVVNDYIEDGYFSSNSNINTTNQPVLKYYSVDTNTIYPPQLEFKWRDYLTVLDGPQSGSIINSSNIKMSLEENPGVFNIDSINRFRVNVSLLYPPRTFQTSSYFVKNNYLPEDSYYAIKDLDTDEFVINFDPQYTQISSDMDGNYFDIYMNGLEPERYYKILIKTNIDSSTRIYDDNYYFKVIKG